MAVKRMTQGSIITVSILIISLFLIQPAVAANDPIIIGGSLPLTGKFADTAKWIKRGMEHWAGEINAQGGLLGRDVKFKIYDDTSSASKAVTFAEKVITVDKADLLFGGYPGTAARAVMPVAEKHKYVYVSMGGHMKSFEQGYTYSFGGPPLMGEWWYEGFYKWMKSLPPDQQPKRAAVYTMNNPIGVALMAAIGKMADDLDLELVIEEKYNLPLPDATPLIVKAKQMNCDILFSNGFFADGVMTVRTAKALNYNPKAIVQGVGSVIPAWVKELGKDGDYVFSGTPLHYKLQYPGNEKLNAYVKEEYGLNGYPLYFGFGYAWMQTLSQAVEGVGNLDQTAIRDWLHSNTVNTIAGPLSFDEKGLPQPIEYCTQIINGAVELIWPLENRTSDPVYPKPEW